MATGNALLMRGSSDLKYTNAALLEILHKALDSAKVRERERPPGERDLQVRDL